MTYPINNFLSIKNAIQAIFIISFQILVLVLFTVSNSYAQVSDYPKKPVTLVVGFTPGGISDVLARALAFRLSAQMGQQVIVENKPGAGTMIAAEYIAKAAPDGYTLFVQDMSTHAVNVGLYKNIPYDPVKDFSHISLVAVSPLMLVVNPSLKISQLSEFIKYAKEHKNSLAFSSSGNGTIPHLTAESFNQAIGIEAIHIPYKGSVASTQAVLANDVAYTFSSMPPALSNAKAGKLVALGVTSLKRVASAKNVPTVSEAGIPGFDFDLYSGVLGPKGMSDALIQKIHYELGIAVKSPEMQAIFETIGAEPMTNSSKEFLIHNTNEIAKLVKVVKAAKIQVN
jgi:tripartite-type tricarboxylate transporter receptor subunit TctC